MGEYFLILISRYNACLAVVRGCSYQQNIQAHRFYALDIDLLSGRGVHYVRLFFILTDSKTVDNGTWDRLVVIPFKGRFRNQETEIKNYGAYLVEHCGGAILSWIIEGAQKYIRNEYKLVIPEEIQAAINEYKEDNDWAADFFNESLVFGLNHSAMGSELYDAYLKYCGCSTLNALPQTVVLPRIAEHPGVTKKRTNKGYRYCGVGVYKTAAIAYLEERARKCREDEWYIEDLDIFI